MNDHSDWRKVFFDQAADQFILCNKNLAIIDVNEATLKLYRKTREQFIGKNISEFLLCNNNEERLMQLRQVLVTGKSIVIDEVNMRTSRGTICNRAKAFKVGDVLGLVLTNITDLKNMIEELDAFSFQSSKDMRNPIVSIQGLINAARYDNTDHDTVFEYYERIQQQATRMNKIQERILETMQIRNRGKNLHPIDFQELAESIWGSMSFMDGFYDIQFNLKVFTSKKFISDKHLLTSLFQNVFDNAIKYRRMGTEESYLNVSVIEDRKGLKIIVADNGIGVEQRFQKDVFKMFFRATDQANGSGLGLYTAHHCVRKLGGTISMDSVAGEGTVFTITLPNEKK